MTTKSTIALMAAGIVSLLILSNPNFANADWRSRQKKLDKEAARAAAYNGRGAWGELHKDRAELRRDQAELERDRMDLRRLYRSGASREEIIRKRREIAGDLNEIGQDRREIREDLDGLGRYRGRNGNGWGNDGWGWERWGNRDRWNYDGRLGQSYGRDWR